MGKEVEYTDAEVAEIIACLRPEAAVIVKLSIELCTTIGSVASMRYRREKPKGPIVVWSEEDPHGMTYNLPDSCERDIELAFFSGQPLPVADGAWLCPNRTHKSKRGHYPEVNVRGEINARNPFDSRIGKKSLYRYAIRKMREKLGVSTNA